MKKVIGTDGAELSQKSPRVKAIHPFGSSVLIELLNPDEILGTNLYIGKEAKVGSAPQAYVIELGAKLNPDEIGLKVGDRILVQGTFIPVDNVGNTDRAWGILEMHNIKAVLEEE
jgi:hypothetical protein